MAEKDGMIQGNNTYTNSQSTYLYFYCPLSENMMTSAYLFLHFTKNNLCLYSK